MYTELKENGGENLTMSYSRFFVFVCLFLGFVLCFCFVENVEKHTYAYFYNVPGLGVMAYLRRLTSITIISR